MADLEGNESTFKCCDNELSESHSEIEDFGDIFKRMMNLVREELQKEYEETRIKGAEFAAQVEANIPIMMELSTKYVLGAIAAKMQAELTYQQTLKTIQEKSLTCRQEIELSANGISKRNVDLSQVDLNYTQRAEAVANGISKREQDELNGESRRELEAIQGTELGLNGTSKRALEAAQTSVAGAQESLYEEQSNSFVKKAQNDAAKTISNMWTIFISEVYGDIGSIPPIVGSGDNMQDMLEDLGRAVDLQIPSSPIPDNPGSKKKIVKK